MKVILKQIAKQRNPFVALALFKKAGKHKKSNKQIRRLENMRTLNSVG